MPEHIRLMLSVEHEIVLYSLMKSFEIEKDMHVVAYTTGGNDILALISENQLDVVIIDYTNVQWLLCMNEVRQIHQAHPGVRVIVLSRHKNRRHVAGFFCAGVSGFLLKSCSIDDLRQAIRLVANGKIYLCSEITGIQLDEALNFLLGNTKQKMPILSERDTDILKLIAKGKKSSEIAECLNISKRTIDIHRYYIMNKLGVRSIAELTKFAIYEGIV